MAYAPIQLFSTPQEDYAAYWLKFYEQGTTTPLSMATDAAAGTLLVKAEISSGGTVPIGFLKTAGDALLNPFIDGAYDGWLFPTEAEADANDTTNAIQVADNLNADPLANETAANNSEWISDGTPTFVSAVSFTLVGDQTAIFHVGRRVQTTNTAGAVYGTISVSAYTSLTTITVVNDSGALDSGLSAVFYGILSASNDSLPSPVAKRNEANTFSGVNTLTATQRLSKGADIASAAALTLSEDGNYFDVTGATTITSIVTVGIGTAIKLQFDSILTLTHHATDLILPSGANITTAAGDEAEFVEYAAGDWRCTNYQKANGTALVGPADTGMILLNSGSESAVATLDIVMTAYTAYPNKVLKLRRIIPGTNAVNLYLLTSTDGGSTFSNTAGDYYYSQVARDEVLGDRSANGNGTAHAQLSTTAQLSSTVANAANFTIDFSDMADTTSNPRFNWFGSYKSSGSARISVIGASAERNTAEDTNAIRLIMSGGTLSLEWELYGYKL